MSPVNSMFVCIKKIFKKISANLFKWPISIIGKMLNIGADNRSTPTANHKKNYFSWVFTKRVTYINTIKQDVP